MILARFVTDFADEALLLPLALAMAVFFAGTGWWRGAIAWVLAVGATLLTMLLLKLLTLACAACWFGPELTSPSGHAAAGTAIYGGLLGLLLPRRAGLAAALAGSVLIAAGFGASRLVLGVHSGLEVAVGGLVGTAGAAGFLLRAGPRPEGVRRWRILLVAGAVAAALHGVHLPAETSIRQAAFDLWTVCRTCR